MALQGMPTLLPLEEGPPKTARKLLESLGPLVIWPSTGYLTVLALLSAEVVGLGKARALPTLP